MITPLEYERQRVQVQKDYNYRSFEQKKIWQGFDEEVKGLTNVVGEEFQRVLDEIGPICSTWGKRRAVSIPSARVISYEVIYDPQRGNTTIQLKQIKTAEGKIIGEGVEEKCPHVYLGPIIGFMEEEDPRITAFKKQYGVVQIRDPPNNCEHK